MEYIDHSGGQVRFALAEAPNEALPLNCRPNFGAAWLAKDKFKVGVVKTWGLPNLTSISNWVEGSLKNFSVG